MKTDDKKLEKILSICKKAFVIVMIALCVLIICSGIYTVQSDEVALVLRFGKLQGNTKEQQIKRPGLHIALPYLIDEIVRVPVGKVKKLTVSTFMSPQKSVLSGVSRYGYLITGDSNIILMKTTVKYSISDPVNYTFFNADVEKMIESTISAQLFEEVAQLDVDTLLTTAKDKLAVNVRVKAQQILNEAKCGVELTNVELAEVIPPNNLKADFDAVNTAAVQKKTYLEEAKQYKESLIPEAQSTAQNYIDTATANKDTAISTAYQNTALFNGLLDLYQTNPETVMETTVREKIAKILQQMNLFIIPDAQTSAKVFLP